MREYIKPFIEEEKIELEDIIAVSGGTGAGDADSDGQEGDATKLW